MKTHIVKSFWALIALLLVFTPQAIAKHLGTVGATYPIAEMDAMKELQAKIAAVDWSKHINKDIVNKKVKGFQPKNLKKLPTAQVNRKFVVDMTYVLDQDIPDGKGGILYPEGYTFNPLDFATLHSTFVIINGNDPKQVDWFKASPYFEDFKTRLVLSDGNYYDLMEKFERPVFYLMEPMARRFQVQAVPSVVQQKGRYLEVSEIFIHEPPAAREKK